MRLRRVPAVLAVLAVLAGATACGGEEEPLDDGTQGVPLAGLGPQVEEAGVEVLGADAPVDANADDVVAALTRTQFLGLTAARPGDADDAALGFDPAATAGLLSVVTDEDAAVVALVFADPAAAAVFAAGDPEVLAGGAGSAYLAGNVVGYVADDAMDGAERVRRALDALDGAGSPSPTASSTASG